MEVDGPPKGSLAIGRKVVKISLFVGAGPFEPELLCSFEQDELEVDVAAGKEKVFSSEAPSQGTSVWCSAVFNKTLSVREDVEGDLSPDEVELVTQGVDLGRGALTAFVRLAEEGSGDGGGGEMELPQDTRGEMLCVLFPAVFDSLSPLASLRCFASCGNSATLGCVLYKGVFFDSSSSSTCLLGLKRLELFPDLLFLPLLDVFLESSPLFL